jgi:hypothetical protein
VPWGVFCDQSGACQVCRFLRQVPHTIHAVFVLFDVQRKDFEEARAASDRVVRVRYRRRKQQDFKEDSARLNVSVTPGVYRYVNFGHGSLIDRGCSFFMS